jgi:hypothetical protein
MRLSTDERGEEDLALEMITAAAEAGITVFDTASAGGRARFGERRPAETPSASRPDSAGGPR